MIDELVQLRNDVVQVRSMLTQLNQNDVVLMRRIEMIEENFQHVVNTLNHLLAQIGVKVKEQQKGTNNDDKDPKEICMMSFRTTTQ